MEGTIFEEILYQVALEHSIKSKSDNIDSHWKDALPDLSLFLGNQVWLWIQRDYMDCQLNKLAWESSQQIEMPDLSLVEDATLSVHAWGRLAVLRTISTKEFQEWVDEYCRPSIVIPITQRQLFLSLVLQWWQVRQIRYYLNEVARRTEGNELAKKTFGALLVTDKNYRETFGTLPEMNKDYQQLFEISKKIANGIMPFNYSWEWEDAQADVVKDWITKLSSMPFHEQIQKLGVTRKAIHDGLIDYLRPIAGQPSFVSLDENIKTSDGRTIPIIELLPAKTEQVEIVEPLTHQQRAQIETLVGKIGREIVEYRREHPEIINTHGEIKELSNNLGYHRNTIRKFLQKVKLNDPQIEKTF